MKISIIHPSRGRPEKSFTTIKKWLSLAETDPELVMSTDFDDPKGSSYTDMYYQLGISRHITGHNKSAVEAINEGAKYASGDIFIVVSDDTDCFPGWDTALLKQVEGKIDWILKTQDGIQKWIITMPIMDRAYYKRFGYIYYPEYKHMFCDTELTCVADLTGRKLTCDLMFKHNHYSVTKESPDAINTKADSTWSQGEKLFIDRYKRNFDLKDFTGKIKSPEYLNWIKGKV